MQKTRQNSVASSESSLFDRSLSYPSAATSTRTSIDSTYAKSIRPDVSSRGASWNGATAGEYVPIRPTMLLRPQRLTGPQSPKFNASYLPKPKNAPGEAFRNLPKEILMVVLERLQLFHLMGKHGTETCSTCWMRDLCSLSLTSRKWAAAARPKLYETIWLVGSDSTLHIKKKFKIKAGSRLKLLRRTLRGNSLLAGCVKELRVPDLTDLTMTKKEKEIYLDIAATLVMACPNLERLIGLYPAHDHGFSRLIHALSTRTNLREHVWNITASQHQRQCLRSDDNPHSLYNLVPGALHPDEYTNFLSCHTNWFNLAAVVLHCHSGGTINPPLLSETISQLPSLSHLALSGLPSLPKDFLASLPPLKSLYLANLTGLRSHDFSALTSSPAARTLVTLTLIGINLTSLPVLARLFSKLDALQRFCIKQDNSPSLPIGTSIYLHPYLASSSLRHLTWDLLIPNDENYHGDATRVLAKAIRADGFPALRMLKAPCDYDGLLQSLCCPVERINSAYESSSWKGAANTLMDVIDERRKDSGVDVADCGYGSGYGQEYSRSLKIARLAAQSRIDSARGRPKIQIIAEDWTDCDKNIVNVTARFEFGGYIGMVGSKIQYSLEPDAEGKDEVGVTVEDLMSATESSCEAYSGTCDGRWNLTADNKGWEHKERAR